MKQRSKNIDDRISLVICEILDGWTGTLSWDSLVDAVELRIGQRYTRQTLNKHVRIKQGFATRKVSLARGEGRAKNVVDATLQASIDHVARLEAENERIKRENANLLEQFVRWTYNAGLKGLNADFLNQPLPMVNRGQTDRALRLKKGK